MHLIIYRLSKKYLIEGRVIIKIHTEYVVSITYISSENIVLHMENLFQHIFNLAH